MREKQRGIVLGTVRHSDKLNVVRVYTDCRGLMAFAVATGSSRGARARAALLMPLSLVEMETSLRPGHDLATMRDLRCAMPLASVYGNPVKSAIAIFIAEVLTHCIQEHERNDRLFNYLYTSVMLLERMTDGVANFHICFLYHLGAHLGIEPDVTTWREGYWFDMDDGTFVASPTASRHQLPPERAQVLRLLSRMTFANLHRFRFTGTQRSEILDTILAYYRLHHSALGTLRSPAVLSALF